jgi:O-methyltransferase
MTGHKRPLNRTKVMQPATDSLLTSKVAPVFMFANKDYAQIFQSDDDRKEFFAAVSKMCQLMQKGGVPFTVHDDIFIWFRSLFWMRDPKFVEAMQEFEDDVVLRARAWRIHNLCWALSQAAHIEGDVVDIGCYEAKSTAVFCNYNESLILAKNLYLYDYFDAPEGDHKKHLHGPHLAAKVEERMRKYRPVVVQGSVLETVPRQLPDEICFAHIDLNGHEAEAHVMPEVYERMPRGAILVFDDYGFSRYRDSGLVHQRFLEGKPERILELPTGQGLLIKL